MSSPAQAPETLGNYVIERALARGSMGHVFVAHHALTHTRVALKVLRADASHDQAAEERFLREVRAAAHIGHEGIVRVYDAGKSADGRLYLAMELLEGETLEARLRRMPGERAQAMQWLHRVLEPLSAAHAQSIVHRDLKPANVFIAQESDRERVKLLDFGLARDTREKSMTATGIALGTPYYMSPEQASEPRKVSTPSDVWSLGVMMYEVLCGTMPFDGETLHAVVIAASIAPHVPASVQAPSLDARLAALVDSCLSKDPSARPQDAGALRERLGPLLELAEVQEELARPVEVMRRKHQGDESRDDSRIPFAETAYSLPTLSMEQPAELADGSRVVQSHGGAALWWWMLSLSLLVLAGGAFLWLVRGAEQSSQAEPASRASADAADRATRADPPATPRHAKPPASGETPQTPEPPAVAPPALVAPITPAADGGKPSLRLDPPIPEGQSAPATEPAPATPRQPRGAKLDAGASPKQPAP